MALRTFTKPALSAVDLVRFLAGKGLIVTDNAKAEHAMAYIGYYRLKIYTRHFEEVNKQFKAGTTFDHILDVYEFDRNLRLKCLDAIERIEVALRACIINEMGSIGSPHFYYNEQYFENKDAVTSIRQLGMKAKHLSVTHYKANYESPALPPIGCLTEASTFGQLSTLYADLDIAYRKRIAKKFGFDETICVSWFRSIAMLRNICAHHNRLWDAELRVNSPKIARAYAVDLANNTKCYARMAVLQALLKTINHNGHSDWVAAVKRFIKDRPAAISLSDMGFPETWENHSLWN